MGRWPRRRPLQCAHTPHELPRRALRARERRPCTRHRGAWWRAAAPTARAESALADHATAQWQRGRAEQPAAGAQLRGGRHRPGCVRAAANRSRALGGAAAARRAAARDRLGARGRGEAAAPRLGRAAAHRVGGRAREGAQLRGGRWEPLAAAPVCAARAARAFAARAVAGGAPLRSGGACPVHRGRRATLAGRDGHVRWRRRARGAYGRWRGSTARAVASCARGARSD